MIYAVSPAGGGRYSATAENQAKIPLNDDSCYFLPPEAGENNAITHQSIELVVTNKE
jgi:hypothetical protein